MKKRMCTRCCKPISKAGLKDPYLCRGCETLIVKNSQNASERFACFD
jgi:hypothetical protein